MTFRPELTVQLADGRIAAPEIFLVDPADIETSVAADDDAYPDVVRFYIFAPDPARGGQSGLDERLAVCFDGDDSGESTTYDCDEFYANVDPAADALFPGSPTLEASPVARGR